MTFIWPSMLFVLLVIPLLVFLYLRVQRRRQARAAGFYALGGGPWAKRQTPGFRRHLPPLLFLLSLAIILVALARPQARVSLPRVEGTVMLVVDVSGSMGATDVTPSRLEVAKAAAREFVLSQPTSVQIGIISFSNSGFIVQAPTNDSNALLSTINRLEPTSGTSVGQGIATALRAIAINAGLATNNATTPGNATPTPPTGQGTQPSQQQQQDLLAQLPPGDYPASVIVLLSDGENNESIDPLAAAKAAADHGVRINTLGFGTTAGTTLEVNGFRVHTALNEAALQQIAQTAHGTYFPAPDEQDRKQVFASLTPQLVVKPEDMEITSVFAGASILFLMIGSLFSMLWFNRLL
jgi:Ca-activated chloride channel family protein